MSDQRKVVVYIAMSLDGYIATEDDSLEWLFKVEGEGDNGYSEFYDTIDAIIVGRRTYDWVIQKEGEDNFPYKNVKCYVYSNTLKGKTEYVEFTNEEVSELVARLKQEEGKDIWVIGGGDLLHDFIKNRLIDEFIINVAPVLIGKGIPLFQKNSFETELNLVDIKRHNQFAELHYVRK